jgi:hypothetical protein
MSKLIKPTSGFTTIPNHIINDKRLSFKAKGLFLYLISKPDGWNFSADRIKNDSKDGEDSVLSGLSELEKLGLLTRQNVRIKGVFKGFDYVLSFDFSPSPENPVTVSPKREKPSTVKPSTEKPVCKKDSLSKKDIDERENISFPPSPDFDIICGLPKDYPLIDEFIDFVSKGSKYPLSYRSSVRDSLLRDDSHRHNRTYLAYVDFEKNRPDLNVNGVLPVGVNIFDLIGRD